MPPQRLALYPHGQRKQRWENCDDRHHGSAARGHRLQSSRQQAHHPLFEQNEYLVRCLDHARLAPSAAWQQHRPPPLS